MNKEQQNPLVKTFLNILYHCRDELLDVLEIKEKEAPEICLHIYEKNRLTCKGFYCHNLNTISLNADIVKNAFNELASIPAKKTGCSRDRLRGPYMIELVGVLAHELKHKQQHYANNYVFNKEFEIEDKLDLNKEEDFKTYSALDIECDARAFSKIGKAIILNEWETFLNVENTYDSDGEKYTDYLIENLIKYGKNIPPEILKNIIEQQTK